MTFKRPTLTREHLQELLDYDPETGVFRWRTGILYATHHRSGVAGYVDGKGYRRICILSRNIAAHRLAWFYMTGEWPENDVDHRNNMRDDNRWANLRKATRRNNCLNRPRNTISKTGYKGVSIDGGRFRARINLERKRTNIGLYATPEQAARAYDDVAKRLHGEFAQLNFPD